MDRPRPRPPPTHLVWSIPVRQLMIWACALPLIVLLVSFIISYYTQYDKVWNMTFCEDANGFPSVSAMVGAYTPQKQIWGLLIFLAVPARFFSGHMYNKFYASSDSVLVKKPWFRHLNWLMEKDNMVEATALIVVSVCDLENCFVIHALSFAVWLGFSSAYMFNNALLHYASGWAHVSTRSYILFVVKAIHFPVMVIFALSKLFTYFYHASTCTAWAWSVFSVTEYVVILLSISFNFIMALDIPEVTLNIVIDYRALNIRINNQLNSSVHNMNVNGTKPNIYNSKSLTSEGLITNGGLTTNGELATNDGLITNGELEKSAVLYKNIGLVINGGSVSNGGLNYSIKKK